jgi:hypothetical protein
MVMHEATVRTSMRNSIPLQVSPPFNESDPSSPRVTAVQRFRSSPITQLRHTATPRFRRPPFL